MKAIKFILGMGLMLAASSAFSQGLEGIVVEKYYKANAADVANATTEGAVTPLTANSVTYRVYVNMAAGYKFNSLFGTAAKNLVVGTSTAFFNDPNSGVFVNPGTVSAANTRKNTVMLDSYFTTGGAGGGVVGVLKTEDTDGTVGNAQNILANNPGGCFGSPIMGASGKDGFLPSSVNSYIVPNALGTGGPILNALDQTNGGSVVITNGSIAALGGVVGATSSNMVLIGQFTTDGEFSFSLNVQIQNIATGVAENYVAGAPGAGELTHPTLTLVPNVAPTVSITSPAASASIITGTAMNITANAADANGTITEVSFYLDGVLLSTDNASPYTASYTAVAGAHSIYAVAIDNDCVSTTSTTNNFSVANNQAPTVVLSTTGATTTVVGNIKAFTATFTDPEAFPIQGGVEFYSNGTLIAGSLDNTAPYEYNYTVVSGAFTITAKASDHLGLVGTSNGVVITGLANNPPSVSITSPVSSASFTSYVDAAAAAGATPAASLLNITFDMNAADDAFGNVTQVELFINGVSVGTDANSPYSISVPVTSGTKTITAKATDNNNAVSTSAPLTLVINDALALPYKVKDVSQLCNLPTFCVPVAVASTYTADNIKGYDVVMTYDATKVAPIANVNTGYNVTVNPLLLSGTGTPSVAWVSVSSAIESPGTLNLTLSLTGNAPANAEWNGTNKDVFCVEFARIAPASSTAPGFQPFQESTVAVSFLQESRITGVIQVPVTSGKMISTTEQNYVANLQFWNGNGAISYDVASPNTYLITNIQGVFADGTATAVAPVVPNVAGLFTHILSTMVGSPAVRTAVPNISIQRDIVNNPLTSVITIINSADAVIAKTILLNQPIGVAPAPTTPSVYQMIACDVNRDGVLSAGDVSQMQQRTVGILEEYQQVGFYNADGTQIANAGPSKDFLFIDPASLTNNPAYAISSTYPSNNNIGYSKAKVPVVPFFLPANVSNYSADDSSCPTVGTANYQGIMLGDANGSYATFAANGTVKGNETDYILVDLNNVIVEGTKVSVPVSIVSAESVNAFDLALGINENSLTYVSAEDTQLGSSTASFYKDADKTFRNTSFNVNTFTPNEKVAYFTFETADGKISEKDFTSEFALLNDKSVDVRFSKSAELGNNTVDIYPNPSNGMFTVMSNLDGRVDIIDITGKLVHPGALVKANQVMEVNMPELSAGVYFVRFYSNDALTTKRIVISE